jgi:mono/diheme cytochrome c family protein
VRRVARIVSALAVCGLAGCSSSSLDDAGLFLQSGKYREDTLRDSLVEASNGYSELRLENYGEWSELPEWNPIARPLLEDDIGAFVGDENRVTTEGPPFFDRDTFEPSHEAWLALGRRAFEDYPMGVDARLGAATHYAETAAGVGLWVDDRGRLGGIARVQLTPEREGYAPTCATCHARVEDGLLIHGAANVDYDYGAIGMGGNLVDSRWGAGRVDVTGDGSVNPVAISDLRPIRLHRRLHRAASVRNSLPALAVRIETLLITSYDERLRPPREVAYALAYYLWHFADEPTPDETLPGAAIFEERCAECHGKGSPRTEAVDLSEVGTDPRVGESSSRGTGQYRVPSLYRVLQRPAILNRGERITVRELLSRENSALGHRYGRGLSDDEKDAIIEYLGSW